VKLPRKGNLIRIVIYGGAIAYLGYAAIMRCQAEQNLESQTIQDQLDAQEGKPTRMITLPDGTQMPVYEITQDEYDAMFRDAKKPDLGAGAPAGSLQRASDAPIPTPTAGDEGPSEAAAADTGSTAEPADEPAAEPAADPAAPTRPQPRAEEN
jgi:hypothetical protein